MSSLRQDKPDIFSHALNYIVVVTRPSINLLRIKIVAGGTGCDVAVLVQDGPLAVCGVCR